MNSSFEKVTTVALLVAVAGMGAIVLRREFKSPSADGRAKEQRTPELLSTWRDMLRHGQTIGNPSARAHLIEFIDFECPACRVYNTRIVRAIRDRFRDSVAVTFLHFPLEMHRFARVAAVASECASRQGAFLAFSELLLNKQDSIGLKSWGSYAMESGISDSTALVRCVSNSSTQWRVDSGRAIGSRLGITATPTLLLNGWQFFTPPSEAALSAAISDILRDKQPFASTK